MSIKTDNYAYLLQYVKIYMLKCVHKDKCQTCTQHRHYSPERFVYG